MNQKGLLDISVVENDTEGTGTYENGKNSPKAILFSKANGENLPNSYYQITLEEECTSSDSVPEKHPKNHSEYQVDFLYKLLPFTLGLQVNEDAKMKSSLVTHNGYRFYFTTYGDEHELLRMFHLWLIESELEQAVGRARLLRCDCTVNLYSNFPLRQAVMRESVYDDLRRTV